MENIRLASVYDAKRLVEIYNPYILNTTITYEKEAVSEEAFAERINKVLENFPWLVYEEDGRILGYAYAARFKERAAFDWDAEVTVYIDDNYRKKSIGSKLYQKLFDILYEQGYVNLYSLIDYPNVASERLHEKFGFEKAFVYKDVAYKFEKWCSLLIMHKRLREDCYKPQMIRDYRLFLT